MMSPTHSLLALAILSKRDAPKRNWAVFIGSIIPDLAIYLWAPYQYLVNDVSGKELWGELYFAPPMQNLIAYFNSIPIYAALALIGWIARGKIWGKLMFFFALAALIHMATDMPVHADDAYRHLWPITDWRFYSPFSYWDNNHHAGWVSLIDVALALGSVALLWRRFPKLWSNVVLGLCTAFYMAVLAAALFA